MTQSVDGFSLEQEVGRYLQPVLVVMIALLGLCMTGLALASGQVVFVRGSVSLVDSTGDVRDIRAVSPIAAGQAVRTGADGHAHLRLDDGSFISVRPNSSFVIEALELDPALPGGVKVRFRLDYGVVRTVTGKAIDKEKHRFRFNTPLVAIGVRGTDYIVHADPEFTRASVHAGAIVLAPLGHGCVAEGLGPCEISVARELTAAMRNTYLEYRAGTHAPVLHRHQGGAPLPDDLAPTSKDGLGTVETGGSSSYGAGETLAQLTAERVTVAAESLPPPPPPAVIWGRWSTVAAPADAAPLVAALLGPDYAMMVGNATFGMLRSSSAATTLPGEGVVGFRLADSEAYLRQGNALTPATLRDAALSIDFGGRQFDTHLDFVHADGVLPLKAAGTVQWQGYLFSDPARSNMDLLGVLGGTGATEAGYLFETPLGEGVKAVGATYWKR